MCTASVELAVTRGGHVDREAAILGRPPRVAPGRSPVMIDF
jgi:hypothetical protein